MMLNTRPIGLVFKQHPRDPANVNAWKNMCDPYIQGPSHKDISAYKVKEHYLRFLHKNTCCGYSVEASRWNTSNEHRN